MVIIAALIGLGKLQNFKFTGKHCIVNVRHNMPVDIFYYILRISICDIF